MEKRSKIMAAMRANVAQEIADALKASGMTRKEFAQKMGRVPGDVTKWLSGNHNFTINLLAEISNVLNCEINAIEIVSGYSYKRPAILKDCAASSYCLSDVDIPFSLAKTLRNQAENSGKTFRQYVCEILNNKAMENEFKFTDLAGSLTEEFPSAEEIRRMRTDNTRELCDIF